MNDADRKYLRDIKKIGPSFEVFQKMVKLLKERQKQADQVLKVLNNTLVETFKDVF